MCPNSNLCSSLKDAEDREELQTKGKYPRYFGKISNAYEWPENTAVSAGTHCVH